MSETEKEFEEELEWLESLANKNSTPDVAGHLIFIRAHVAALTKERDEARKAASKAEHYLRLNDFVPKLDYLAIEQELSALKALVQGSPKVGIAWKEHHRCGEVPVHVWLVGEHHQIAMNWRTQLVYALPVDSVQGDMSTASPHQQNVSKNEGEIDV